MALQPFPIRIQATSVIDPRKNIYPNLFFQFKHLLETKSIHDKSVTNHLRNTSFKTHTPEILVSFL